MIYYDGHLILAQNKSLRCIDLVADEVSTTVDNFQAFDYQGQAQPNDNPVKNDKWFTGIISENKIINFVDNQLRNEIVCVSVDSNNKVLYYKLIINKGQEDNKIELLEYVPADYKTQPPKFDPPTKIPEGYEV